MSDQVAARVTIAQLQDILTPRMPENPVVITTCLLDNTPGKPASLLGLGDHSVLSTLPKRFHDLGYDVYLDKDVQASNSEILELVWYSNPYIKGLTDRKPNAGYTRQGKIYEIANSLQGHRGIEAVERAHGLPPRADGTYSMCPWYNYTPKAHHAIDRNTVLVDYAAVSSTIGRDRLAEHVRATRGAFRNCKLVQVLHPPWVAMQGMEQYLEATYLEQTVFEYIDMIASCRAWVGSEAGAQCLASFARGEHRYDEDGVFPDVRVTSNCDTLNDNLYAFPNVFYKATTGGARSDFHMPREMDDYRYANTCRVRGIEFEMRRKRADVEQTIVAEG